MNENELIQENEVSLFDLWGKLRDGWKIVAGGLVAGIACAALGILLISPKYQAKEIIQIGMVAGKEIESSQVAIERVKSPSFAMDVAKLLGDQELINSLVRGEDAGSLGMNVNFVKGASLIELVADGKSSMAALKKVRAMNQLLLSRHEKLSLPFREKLIKDIQIAKDKLDSTELDLAELEKITLPNKVIRDSQFAPISLLASQRAQRRIELFGLRQQLISMQMLLLPPSTQPTNAIEQAFAGSEPVSPKNSLLLALGIIGGLLGGIGWVLIANTLLPKIR